LKEEYIEREGKAMERETLSESDAWRNNFRELILELVVFVRNCWS